MWERRLVGGVAATAARLINRRSIEAAYRAASRASSPYTVQSIQIWKLRRALRHAARHSPFYRELFRRHAVDVERVAHPAELGDLTTSPGDLVAGCRLSRADLCILSYVGSRDHFDHP